MKQAFGIASAVILALFALALNASQSEHVYLATAEQADAHLNAKYAPRGGTANAVVFRWPALLRPGDKLDESLFPGESPVTIRYPSWLYFVDLQPGALYTHPVQFVLVRQNGGHVRILNRHSFPSLNGVHLFSTLQERFSPVLRVARPEEGNPEMEEAAGLPDPDLEPAYAEQLSRCNAGCGGGGPRRALVVDGGATQRIHDERAVEILRSLGYSVRHLSSVQTAPQESLGLYPADLAHLQAALDWLAEGDCCSETVILVHANASPRGELVINPRRRVPVYSPATGFPTGHAREIGSVNGGLMSVQDLRARLDALNTCRGFVYLQAPYAAQPRSDASLAQAECLCRVEVIPHAAGSPVFETAYGAFLDGMMQGSFDAGVRNLGAWSRAERVSGEAPLKAPGMRVEAIGPWRCPEGAEAEEAPAQAEATPEAAEKEKGNDQ